MYLANAGLHFADACLCSEGSEGLPGPGPYALDAAGHFAVEADVLWDHPYYSVKSTGTAGPGSPFQAVYQAQRLIKCADPEEPLPDETAYYVTYSGGGGESGQFFVPSGGLVDGSLYSESVSVQPNSIITGNIIAETSVTLSSGVQVGGWICSGGDVILSASNITIGGNIHAWGNVVLGSGATAEKNIYATGHITLNPSNAKVLQEIHAGGDVTLGSNTLANSNVFLDGSLLLRSSNSRVKGDVHAGGNITMQWNTYIEGSVWAGGSISTPQPQNIWGAEYAGQPSPPRILPTPPDVCPDVPVPRMQTFSAGTQDINMPPSWQETQQTITPGSYRDLNWQGGVTLTIEAGSCRSVGDPGCYYFREFNGGLWGQTLRLDLSTGDEITIFCEGDISHTGPVLVSTDGSTWVNIAEIDMATAKELAARVYWETHEDFEITGNNGTRQWFGTVLARNHVDVPSASRIIGTFATVDGSVTAGSNPSITYSLAQFASEHW
jgi:predicted acyltransferase (DUF342 family)